MKKDDIEKLFSSLEDFSKNPPDELWIGIEEKLHPEKKKALPYWWAIAASLVIGLGLLATFNFNSGSKNSLITTPVENGVVNQLKSFDSLGKDNVSNKVKEENTIINGKTSKSLVENENENPAAQLNKPAVVNRTQNKNQPSQQNKAVVVADKKDNTAVKNSNENKIQIKQNGIAEKGNQIADVNQAITEKKDVKVKDDLASTSLADNALAAIAKGQENQQKKAVVEDKWSLQVFAGVNSSQNLKNQKTLGNTIESQTGHSYGVKTNYKLNSRWAVSTGLKISELGQQVANVSYVNQSKNLLNISKAPYASPQEKGTISTNSDYLFIPNNNAQKNSALASTTFYQKGDLSQKVQYIEMPMEISYALLNKGKARINMNTGGFVGKMISNKVLLDNNLIGENQEVNDVVFGTVLSSTLQYEVFKKTKVFVEPGMNYYTQPVQNQNFNQFQLIFNFGLNVSF
ncbi:hypothetical protein SAMN05443543_10942 [Flavobacterium flevense]|uniref:Outer membrane protein beta-barrel domain-containing protein n=1 Tax=Flavobacterium flevense TaxID=983 RepID=A0A4Y4B1S3_9FLAO|nr:hypothetical protein [Flavobacterium flevense]GEC73047.1 hypothetical protein FFL01_25860 [Flavobacterium flevense]SHM03160.1 hypothetical protein SAMN05443543_10942 [Flavobacterium flevense]